MSETNPGTPRGAPARFYLHLSAFVVLLGVWTWLLLEPYPVPPAITEGLSANLRLILAKSLHAGVYAFLAVLGATLPVARRWRVFVVGFLVLHGVGTEIGQTYVPNRTGKVTDVLIDWGGITTGLLALRWWRRRPA
jgi:VanZ family protein